MEKTIRPQLRRERSASAPEKWDGTYTGILESMDSGERGREPVGEMGRSQFPDHGADARPAAAVIHPENLAFRPMQEPRHSPPLSSTKGYRRRIGAPPY
ncbi:MAG: hypothetical protein C6W57_03080 [Caldibacillus debilis]|nr:MAG: hypothetical protein C6W57_03080 [Caldibacillus debilis]